jgi:hypothetical protein
VRAPALVAVAVLVAAAAWWFLRPEGTTVVGPGAGDGAGEEETAPHLAKADPVTGTTSPRRRPEGARDGEEEPAPVPDRAAGPAVTGVVLDHETGKPMPGVRVVAEISETTCPRFPDPPQALWGAEAAPRAVLPARRPFRGAAASSATTDAEGAFAIPWRLTDVRADLFARRAGWLVACACAVAPGAPVTIRLEKGSEIRGVVVRGDGRAVAGAVVRCRPAPGTPILPGHADAAKADDEGRFALTGLLPGPVIVEADHPKFVPTTLEPMEPGRKDLRIVLVPAFLATFEITTDDAKEPDAPSLAWKTTGVPPRTDLLILRPHVEDVEVAQSPASPLPAEFVPTEQGAWRYAAVRIPCDRPDVSFELKAVGYEPWTAGPEPLPIDGGEKTFPVLLRRDLSLGSLRLLLEDRDGKALSFVGEKAEATPWRRDRQPIPGGIVLKPGDVLEFPALPHGPYGILVRSPLHAPVVLAVDVPAGRATEQKVVVGPPAKMRIRFTAPEAVIVRFRLMSGKDPAFPFPEGTTVAQEEEGDPSKDPVLHAGAEGLVLTGLAAGRYTVEVLNPDLVAPPTAVDLVESETREVEVALQRR